jgi:hypothetical protein
MSKEGYGKGKEGGKEEDKDTKQKEERWMTKDEMGKARYWDG